MPATKIKPEGAAVMQVRKDSIPQTVVETLTGNYAMIYLDGEKLTTPEYVVLSRHRVTK